MNISSTLHINDPIWGTHIIDTPVLIDLINSNSIQRLKKIDQSGFMHPYYPHRRHNRYEHSVGVMLLLKKYKADLNEVIMGLLHDFSHTAFSHCADYFLISEEESHKQEFQDDSFESMYYKSEIPDILRSHNFDPELFADDSHYRLLERESRVLCADRIDYSLRGSLHYGLSTAEEINKVTSALKRENDFWYFDNINMAKKYQIIFKTYNDKIMSGPEAIKMHYRMSGTFRYLLSKDYFTKEDFFKDDEYVLEKLNILGKSSLEANWCMSFIMNEKHDIPNEIKSYFPKNKIKVKERIIDPLIKKDNSFFPLSLNSD